MRRSPGASLDERYLAFAARTRGVFESYPQLEPLRHYVFKDLLVGRQRNSWWQQAKHWWRPIRRRSRMTLPGRADLLIWLESGREVIVEALLPVYHELVRRGVNTALVSDGGPPELPEGAVQFRYPARALAPKWASEAWEALGASEPALREHAARRSFLQTSAMLQGRLDEQARLLDAMRPRMVIAASTQLMGGAALTVRAREFGVSSALLQHGILQPFYCPLIADSMLTWGPSSNEILLKLGVPEARLVVTGSPRHDCMRPSDDGRAGERFRRALGLPNRPTFVFFSNGNDLVRNGSAPAECAAWLEATAAAHANELNVVVRLHPNEDGVLYRRCRRLTITRDVPRFAETLDGCDGVGSLCSTVLYDALLYGKPIWQFHADGWPVLATNWQEGLARRVSSAPELDELVGAMLADRADRCVDAARVARVFANHGRATHAGADVVANAMTSRRATSASAAEVLPV